MKTYQVIQNPEWANPGMLIFVDDNGNVVGNQANPDNTMTQTWAEDGSNWGQFDPSEYAKAELIDK